VIDVQAVLNIEDVPDAAVLIDPVHDAISAAPSAVTTGERPGQRLANSVRGCPQARHRRTPTGQRQQLPGAAGRSLAVRHAERRATWSGRQFRRGLIAGRLGQDRLRHWPIAPPRPAQPEEVTLTAITA
jgi:hypothetical protein